MKIIVTLSAEEHEAVKRAETTVVLLRFASNQWQELQTFQYLEHPAVFANIHSIGTFAAVTRD